MHVFTYLWPAQQSYILCGTCSMPNSGRGQYYILMFQILQCQLCDTNSLKPICAIPGLCLWSGHLETPPGSRPLSIHRRVLRSATFGASHC